MQRLTRCMVMFGAVGALSAVSACSGDPTNNQGTPTEIVANPAVVFVDQGQSQGVVVTVVDEDGQPLEAEFTLSNVGAGITVTPDPDFLPVTGGNPLRRQARFVVQGDELTAATFRVEALGLTKDIQVTSIPPNLAATLSNLAPALGDTITITAPPGTFFSQTSAVGFGVQDLVITDRAADGSVITFIPAPTIHGPLTVTEVNVTSNPNLTFTLNTTETLVTDSIVNVAGTFSNQTPALGETVTLTLPAGLKLLPTATGLTIIGAAQAPRDPVVAGDSSSITFVPAPNSDSLALIPGVIAARLPMYPQTLPTTTKVTTPAVTALPSTLSSTTPLVNVPVVLTSTDANFTFVDPAEVTVGIVTGSIVTGQTASTINFLPPPGSTGVVAVGSVDVAGFGLPLPSTAGAITTSSTVPAMAGTDDPATAPVITIPASGSSGGFFDAGAFAAATCGGNSGVPCQLYKFTLAAGGTFDVRGTWSNEADIGLYFLSADGTTDTGEACDDHGRGGDAQPEECTITLAAGTYLLGVVNFGPFYPENDPNPDWIGLAFSTP